jgi:hypothetical protein
MTTDHGMPTVIIPDGVPREFAAEVAADIARFQVLHNGHPNHYAAIHKGAALLMVAAVIDADMTAREGARQVVNRIDHLCPEIIVQLLALLADSMTAHGDTATSILGNLTLSMTDVLDD